MSEPIETAKKRFARKSDNEHVYDFGKLPPQAKELEECVLCAVMIDSKALPELDGMLRPEMFYVDAHQRVFKACLQLATANNPIDLETVVMQLKKNEDLEA